MQNLRLILILLLLLSGGISGHGFSSEMPETTPIKEYQTEISEDIPELSPSRISSSTSIFLPFRLHSSLGAIPVEVSARENSKAKAYFSCSRFIEPGLSLSDIIYPFHIFL